MINVISVRGVVIVTYGNGKETCDVKPRTVFSLIYNVNSVYSSIIQVPLGVLICL